MFPFFARSVEWFLTVFDCLKGALGLEAPLPQKPADSEFLKYCCNREEGTYLLATDGLWKLETDQILLTINNKENYNEIDDLAFVLVDPW